MLGRSDGDFENDVCDVSHFVEWYEDREEMADGGCTSQSERYSTELQKPATKNEDVYRNLRCEAVVEYLDLVEDLEGFLVDLVTGK